MASLTLMGSSSNFPVMGVSAAGAVVLPLFAEPGGSDKEEATSGARLVNGPANAGRDNMQRRPMGG
jgi:hypothetical protein